MCACTTRKTKFRVQYKGRTILPKGLKRRPCWIPGWNGAHRHRAGSRHSTVWPLHRQSGEPSSSRDTPHDQGRFRRSFGTHRTKGRLRPSPLHPSIGETSALSHTHRPTLRASKSCYFRKSLAVTHGQRDHTIGGLGIRGGVGARVNLTGPLHMQCSNNRMLQ